MATQREGRIQRLMEEGCPYYLTLKPDYYLDLVDKYLDSIGQLDGRWSDQGKELIPELYPESSMCLDVYDKGYQVRVHRDVVQGPLGQQDPWDLVSMSMMTGVELAGGWVLFPVLDTKEKVHWLMRGMLFPDYDGETEGWVVYLPARHVLVN